MGSQWRLSVTRCVVTPRLETQVDAANLYLMVNQFLSPLGARQFCHCLSTESIKVE
jgi:hypothetical protein